MKAGRSSVEDLEAYIPGLRRFARALLRGDRVLADDLVQDSLERALSRWCQRRQDGDLRAWVFTILYHRFVTDRQQRLARQAWMGSLTGLSDEELPAVDGRQEQVLGCRDLMRGLAQVPEDQRAVLLLVGIDEFTYEEAARILDVPIGTVMSRLSRGRERLRQCLEGGGARAQSSRPATDRPPPRRLDRRPHGTPALSEGLA